MQAAIITAYKNFDQLFTLVSKLLEGDFKIFIHIDRKSYPHAVSFLERITDLDNVYILSRYNIEWGSINHLYAILDLIQIATIDSQIHFIHIISAQDYPIQSIDYINKFFSSHNEHIYMTVTEQENFDEEVRSRYEQYYLFNKLDSRKPQFRNIAEFILKVQKRLGVKRKAFGNFKKLYKGMVWISAPSQVFTYILQQKELNNSLLNFLRFCRVPEEFFFQTVILNSPYNKHVIRDNLRFTLWKEKHNSIPAILDIDEYDSIKATNAIFARKFDPIISSELLSKIKEK